MSTRPIAAIMIVAASTAMGRAWNNPVAKTSNNAIRTAANMPESGERAPASALTAVREKPPVTGKGTGERTCDIGGTQSAQLCVGIDALPVLAGKSLGNGDAFHKADQTDGQRRQPQLVHDREIDGRHL